MARPRLDPERRRPTEAEASILATLWEHGPSTVRQVHEHLASQQDVGLTTVLKLMQIMAEKGLLVRDTSVRPQVFSPARDQADVQADMVGDLLDRIFGGSTENLVLRALSTRPSSPEEIAAIRRHLDALDGGDQ
jgi:BlaI family transcriptional regulator, penicillinase repressor